MIFLVKALAGTVAVAVPVSIGTAVAYRESIFGNSGRGISVSDLKDKCYVIPAEDSENKTKLLICNDKSYFLYNDQGNNKTDIPERINKKGGGLEIWWESWEGNADSVSTSRKNTNLKVNDGGWGGIKEDTDLKATCNLVTGLGGADKAEWQCKGNSSLGQETSEVKIQLTKFSG